MREFTYAKNKFTVPAGEYELADNIISLDDIMIVYQLKERDPSGTRTPEQWFNRNIIGTAKKQIKDTLLYLDQYSEIRVINQQGHEFPLSKPVNSKIHKVMLYSGIDPLPNNCKDRNFYISSGVVVIHIFHSSEYKMVVENLVTITEIEEYLSFREKIINQHHKLISSISEEAIVGQFLSREYEELPSNDYIIYFKSLKEEFNDWDVTGILHTFKDKIIKSDKECDYYYIFKEIAKLTRGELKDFKERYMFSMNIALNFEDASPRTMAIMRTGCGFVFYTCPRENINKAINIINMLTKLYKYYQKLEKCTGVIFVGDEKRYCDVFWCYIDGSFMYDPNLEQELEEYNPFFVQKKKQEKRYDFYDAMMLDNGCVIRIV